MSNGVFDEVKEMLGGSTKVGSKKLYNYTHLNLLWDARNFLIHAMEIRPWAGIDLFEGDEPYYHWFTPTSIPRKKLQGPIYPSGFIGRLTRECFTNLQKM